MFDNTVDLANMSFEEGLLAFELSLDDLFLLKKQKNAIILAHVGVSDKTPAREAFEAFFVARGRSGDPDGLRPSSLSTYRSVLNEFYIYCRETSGGEIEVEQILDHIIGFMIHQDTQKSFKATTWNKYVAILHSFAYFVADHYLVPKRMLPEYRPHREEFPQSLRDGEVIKLLEIAKSANYALRAHFLVIFLLTSGLRRDEFRNVQLRDIDFKNMVLHVRHGKGDRQRFVNLPNLLKQVLEPYLQVYRITQPEHYVYGNIADPRRPVSNQAIDQVAHRLFVQLPTYEENQAAHRYRLHALRHTYATSMLKAGVPLNAIAKCLGHTSLVSTERYTVLDTESIRDVIRPGFQRLEDLLLRRDSVGNLLNVD